MMIIMNIDDDYYDDADEDGVDGEDDDDEDKMSMVMVTMRRSNNSSSAVLTKFAYDASVFNSATGSLKRKNEICVCHRSAANKVKSKLVWYIDWN